MMEVAQAVGPPGLLVLLFGTLGWGIWTAVRHDGAR